jgi:hypothetical protein
VFQKELEDLEVLASKLLAYARLTKFPGFEVNLKYPELDNTRLGKRGFHLLTPGNGRKYTTALAVGLKASR